MTDAESNTPENGGESQSGGEVFEVDRIRELVALMKDHDLSEIDLRQAHQRIRLCRGGSAPVPVVAPALQAAAPPPVAASAPAPAAPAPAAAPAQSEGDHIVYIKAPMVGTFYTKPNPNSEPFVKVGDNVDPETTVCIVEAMKVFNEIPAEIRGQIVAVLADNEEPVDFGKPLFKVDTSK